MVVKLEWVNEHDQPTTDPDHPSSVQLRYADCSVNAIGTTTSESVTGNSETVPLRVICS